MEDKKFAAEEAIRFLDLLESENEEAVTNMIDAIRDVELKMRESEYALQETEKNHDPGIHLFSPIGVYEEGEEKKNLYRVTEELKGKLSELNEKLKQYTYRREQIRYIRNTFTEMQKYSAKLSDSEQSDVTKMHNLQILEGQEYDRNRIARDLHDTSVQSLTSLVHKTELCMRLIDVDTVRVKLELQTMIETIKTIINGMREIIYDLRPMSLNNLGLAVTIDSYCFQLKKSFDIEVIFHEVPEEPELPSIWKLTLYRILQEACSNVIKHARASKIDITLSYEKERVLLIIKDNGIGFLVDDSIEPVKGENLHGFGLSMMKERASLLGGEVQIVSAIGEGTTLTVVVPLVTEKEKNDGNN